MIKSIAAILWLGLVLHVLFCAPLEALPGLDWFIAAATLDFSMRYPESWGARVTVHHPKAGMITKSARFAKGDPEEPLSAEELVEKADALLEFGGYTGSEDLALLAEAPTSTKPFEVSLF